MGKQKSNIITITGEDIAARYGIGINAVQKMINRKGLVFSSLDDFVELLYIYETRAIFEKKGRITTDPVKPATVSQTISKVITTTEKKPKIS